jgi:hypothetical protein
MTKYDLFVRPNFTSPRGDKYRPGGGEFYQECGGEGDAVLRAGYPSCDGHH